MPTTTRQTALKTNPKKLAGKKTLPGPTHLGHFIMVLLMRICRAILFVDTSVKVFVYFGVILTLSVIGHIFVIPPSYLSQKRNVFNDYFLKLGWGWTLFCVGTYIFFTSLVYCSRDVSKMCKHGLRLVVGTVWWYFCTVIVFRKIELSAGACSDSLYEDPKACFRAGKYWRGFDISGHVFLEVFCSLLILEEMKTFKDWRKLGILLDDEDLKDKRKVTADEIVQAKEDYRVFTPFIKISVVLVAIISILFDLMLFSSTLYPFHTLSEEIFGFLTAVGAWFLSYHVFFRSGSSHLFIPSAIGECSLSFMK